jgi:tetratricopeptide (TPR) repeat protein
MKYSRILLLLCVTGLNLNLATQAAHAANDDAFLEQLRSPSEQAMGQGRSAIWTLPLVATQYQPLQATPAMQAALQAQQEGSFLDALILLDDARKNKKTSADTLTELDFLRASFLLQGNQYRQALDTLSPLSADTQHAADAYALTAMTYLQQGKMQEALNAAQHAQTLQSGVLPHLVLSYTLQAMGRLAEAREVMQRFNQATPSAITLAREAELALTLDQIRPAKTLMDQARTVDAAHPYVIAVSGLVYLIDGHAREAKAAFETTLRRDPKDAKALLGLGLAEIKLGNFKAGQAKLQAANEADSGNALILTYLGRAQQQLGQTEAARTSWHSAQQADPKDPVPWLYQAQAELQGNQPLDARESLRQAQDRLAYRAVYRGERLLKQDEQILQANLSEVQRQLGMESLAFQTLSDSVGEKNSASLRNQADVLQGQRFAESARRSLLLQSQFNAKPGSLPSELDIYGDGAGHTGAVVPQHGVISGLNAEQSSYNNYDELFSPRATLSVDATKGSQNSKGEQIRAGVGSDTLGVSIAQLQYSIDGLGAFNNLDNHILQATAQWRPSTSAQAFVSYQLLNSLHGEIEYPADPQWNAMTHQYADRSSVTRLGLRYSLNDNSELRALLSRQQTSQKDNWQYMSDFLPSPYTTDPSLQGQGNSYDTSHNSSYSGSTELQYRRSGADYATQWGMSSVRSPKDTELLGSRTIVAQQIYAVWQQALHPLWQVEAGLAWSKSDRLWDTNSTSLRRWQPKLGVIYTPDSATHVRLAAWRKLDDAAVGNASLAPVTLAGIVLNRPGDNSQLAHSIALSADRQLQSAWLLEGQTQRRWTDYPIILSGAQQMSTTQIDTSRLALHWQPGSLKVTLAYDDELIQNDPGMTSPDSVHSQHLRSQQLGMRWFASPQWTANLALSHNQLNASQHSTDSNLNPILLDIQDRFNQADASLNWQFTRKGSLNFGVRNASDRSVLYTETDPLVPRFSKGRLWYARLKLAL